MAHPYSSPFLVGTLATLLCTTALADSLPTGGTVSAGSVAITSPSSSQMNINQGSDAAIVNWNSFSIGQDAQVNIAQPTANSTLLNRVTGNTTSQIHGQLHANGQVFLVNPNGIFIGPNGHVQTGGFVASTLDINNDDFLTGQYRFNGHGSSASVENAGQISVVPGGYAALMGGKVKNSGVIRVPLGKVGLAAGEQITLDVSGDGFLQVAVPSDSDDSMDALVENSGLIEANGGQVHLLAASARDAARQVVNMSGVIEAQTVGGRSGAVVLGGSGGSVNVSGTINASAQVELVETSPRPVARPATGGDITITGEQITLAGAELLADGAGEGQGGLIRVGGDYQGSGTLQHASHVDVDADTRLSANGGDSGDGGRIIVWSDVYTEFDGLISARGGDIAGDGGFAEVSGKLDLRYRGLADLRAPNGEVGLLLLDPTNITVPGTIDVVTIESNLATTSVELNTNGTGSLVVGGSPTDLGGSGTDVGDITINSAITWNSFSEFRLTANRNVILNAGITGTTGEFAINAGGTITTGASGAVNVGTFRLENGTWSQVNGTLPAFQASDFQLGGSTTFLRALGGDGSAANPYQLADIYGVQGVNSTSLSSSNFVLANDIDASGTSGWFDFGEGFEGFQPISSFDGTFDGMGHTIDGLFVDRSGAIGGLFTTLGSGAVVTDLRLANADIVTGGGGILAAVNNGLIEGSSVSGSMSNQSSGGFEYGDSGPFGGMVGTNNGTIRDSFSLASVSYQEPGFGSGLVEIGGLAGVNDGTILRSHAGGTVTGTDPGSGSTIASFHAGGLVGENGSTGSIQSSYAIGDVTLPLAGGTGTAGGLIGNNAGGTVSASYSIGGVSVSNGTAITGGLAGANTGTVSGSFWDTGTSGQSTSAGGTGLNTAQFQDTDGFVSLASAVGWDFANNWAPGAFGLYPQNYTTSPVIYVTYDPLSAQYGSTFSATATGTVTGGPGTYLFGPAGDTLDTAPAFTNLFFADDTVGSTTFATSTTSLNSSQGITYDVAALSGAGTVTPAPLTITANDQSKTYGTTFSFDGTEFTATGLIVANEDFVSSVTLTSAGSAEFASVAGSPYAIVASNATGGGLSNYDITYVNGQLTVDPAFLSITPDFLSRTYGDGFAFTGTEFTTTGLLGSDTVTSVTLTSAGAAQFAPASGSAGYLIESSNAIGSGVGNYDIFYDTSLLFVDPASLTVTALNQVKPEGLEFVFNGTEFTTSGLVNPADNVASAQLQSAGASADATIDDSPYAISVSNATGSGLSNYVITYVAGLFDVVEEINVPYPPIPKIEITPTVDTKISTGGGGGGSSTGGTAVTPVEEAAKTLDTVEIVSDDLDARIASCGGQGDDVALYLACLADAMDDYAGDLESIASDLPPGLEQIGDIVRGAAAGVREAGENANRRLALATTAAERESIRREAATQARRAIQSAQSEIRKAITLIRADDPELAGLQRQQVETIVQAVGRAEISLSRVLEL